MAILDRERDRNLYNSSEYENNTNNWEDEVSEFRADAFMSALEQAGIVDEISSILDVGCGAGGVLAEMAMNPRLKRASLRGIDISETAISIALQLAQKKGVQNRISYAVQSVTDVLPEEKVSVLSLIHVLEHVPDMLEMLEECASRSDYQYINVPLEFNLFYCLRPGIPAKQYEKYGHVHFFDEEFFATWLERNGFQILAKVYSRDYMVNKVGIRYKLFRLLRKTSENMLGPLRTVRLLAGLSGGYLVKKAS